MLLPPKNSLAEKIVCGAGVSIGTAGFIGGGGFSFYTYLLTEIEIASLAGRIGVAAIGGVSAIGFSIYHFIESVFNNRE